MVKSNCTRIKTMILSFHPCFDADIQIILGDRSIDSRDIELIHRARAVILPQGQPQDIYKICSKSGVLMFPGYKMRFKYPGKIGQSHLFKEYGFPFPKTLRWKSVKEFKETYADLENFPHEIPFLIKANNLHEAEGIYLVENMISLSEALGHLGRYEVSGLWGFVTQDCVSSGGNVLRAVIIGNRVITYWKRPDKSRQIITTISRGAIIDYLWRPALQEKGKEQASALLKKTGVNLAAVDFVFPLSDEEPDPLFLEINYYFGRRGLGGSIKYYGLLFQAIQEWLTEEGLNPKPIRLI